MIIIIEDLLNHSIAALFFLIAVNISMYFSHLFVECRIALLLLHGVGRMLGSITLNSETSCNKRLATMCVVISVIKVVTFVIFC